MKTVLQQFIDWMEDPTITLNQDKDNCIREAKELLEKEKQQIIDAYTDGCANWDNYDSNPEQYYNETYNTK